MQLATKDLLKFRKTIMSLDDSFLCKNKIHTKSAFFLISKIYYLTLQRIPAFPQLLSPQLYIFRWKKSLIIFASKYPLGIGQRYHSALGEESTSTFRRLHMGWLFWILETCQTRFEHHWIRKSSLKFTP